MTRFNQTLLSEFDNALRRATDKAPSQTNEPACQWVLCGHLFENSTAQKIPVKTQPFTVGRHPENSVCVANATVSGHHAEILIAGDKLLVRDRDSTNGTLLNGRRLQTVESLRDGDILHFGNVMFTVQHGNSTTATETVTSDAAGDAIAQVQFNTLMQRPGVDPFFQPIIDLNDNRRIGYEVLSRSQFIGLETPAKMFKVAAQRTSEAALSRICRVEGMRASRELGSDMVFYLNTHPAELNDNGLFDSLYVLREQYPEQSIMLEVHESGVTSVDFLRKLREILNEVNMGLAYDDFDFIASHSKF